MFNPEQLMLIGQLARQAHKRDPLGIFLEIGCAYGATTIFLKKLLPAVNYISVDTFSGFTPQSVAVEVQMRGKAPRSLRHNFTVNSMRWYTENLTLHGVTDVKVYQTDVCKFDFNALPQVAFCLLDVDLYQPIAHCLPFIYDKLSPYGVIVVDDCLDNHTYDGAMQAYKEFCQSRHLQCEIAGDKLGILGNHIKHHTVGAA